MKGRGLSPGLVTAEVVVCDQLISPLGEISKDGFITSGPCENTNISNKILAFKGGRGSTVGSYTFLELKNRNISPSGIINEAAEQMVVTGAIITDIPMVDGIPLDTISTGESITMNGSSGEISISNVKEAKVATVYLMREDKLLLLKRSKGATSFPAQYSGISGYIERGETPEQTGKREAKEECGIIDASLVTIGEDIYVRSGGIIYEITPILMKTESKEVKLNYENSDYVWVDAQSLSNYETVPKFKETFETMLSKTSSHA